MQKFSYLLIAIGAALWGFIGIFVQALRQFGFTPLQVVTIRVTTAGIILLIYVIAKDKSLLKIKASDFKYFFATGILSIVFFNWCYFTAIQHLSLSVAVVLLYTAPAFVTVISYFVFKEEITKRKILALVIMTLGCILVVGLLPVMRISISLFGLLIGLGSGVGYALYSIFGKLASYKYHSITITTYTFLFATAALLPFSGLWQKAELLLEGQVLIYSLGLGLFPTVLAYVFYTIGLTHVETSRAAIMSNIEPVVAMLVGIIFFGDILTGWQILGSILVLLAAVSIQEGKKEKGHKKVRGHTSL